VQAQAVASVRSVAAGVHEAALEGVSCPRPKSCIAGTFYSVSCARAGNCVAVGMLQGRTRNLTLSQRWNGRSWKLMTAARIGRSAALTGVHCTASGFCTAHIAGGLVDGLYQVSCPTAARCIAVGARTNGGLGAIGNPLAEEWNGVSWRVLRTPNP
jgi:hypothetical protein